jgi:uncharacterized UPF0160 family protein
MVRGTFLGKDLLSVIYIKNIKKENTNLNDSECINIISEFNKHGLKQEIFCSILKSLSRDLVSFISGAVGSFSQNSDKLINDALAMLKGEEALIEHKFNAKGRKTKAYKTFLQTYEIRKTDVVSIAEMFFESGNDFFDLPEKNKRELLMILFSVANYSRLFTSRVDLTDQDIRDDLLASICGRNSERMSKDEVLGIFGNDLEEVMVD